jgi:hypothetical protein
MSRFHNTRIVLGVTGSIAAYKAVSLLRALMQEGADVHVVMTASSTKFVSSFTFEILSQHSVHQDLFSGQDPMSHLRLTETADLVLVAPSTAHTLAKGALGLADDLLSTMILAARCPLVFAPAMDGEMWEHPTVREHTQVLRNRGVTERAYPGVAKPGSNRDGARRGSIGFWVGGERAIPSRRGYCECRGLNPPQSKRSGRSASVDIGWAHSGTD